MITAVELLHAAMSQSTRDPTEHAQEMSQLAKRYPAPAKTGNFNEDKKFSANAFSAAR